MTRVPRDQRDSGFFRHFYVVTTQNGGFLVFVINLKQKNSRRQGDVGTAMAVSYFALRGYTVSIPLSDSQPYDLLVDDGEKILRVQCKTTAKKISPLSWRVELRTISNTRGRELTIRKFSRLSCDILFVVTGDGDCYSFPAEKFDGKGLLTLNHKMDPWKVNQSGTERDC